MKTNTLACTAFFAMLFLTSCQAVEGIFKAGMWWGIILVVGVIVLIFWLLGRKK